MPRSHLMSLRGSHCSIPANVMKTLRLLCIYKRSCTRRSKRAGKKTKKIPDSVSKEPVINFGLWNARSIRPAYKISAVCDLIIDQGIDIFAITETWLRGDQSDGLVVSDLMSTLANYELIHQPRSGKTGGGVALVLRSSLFLNRNPCQQWNTFEYLDVSLRSDSKIIRLVVIYRAPSSRTADTEEFLTEFSTLLETLVIAPGHLLITGDFNLHLDQQSSRVDRFKMMLSTANLVQHVDGPTHTKGHTLDLLITSMSDKLVSNISVLPTLPSDHYVISCQVAIQRPAIPRRIIEYRRLKAIDIDAFCHDIAVSSLVTNPANDLEELVCQYNNVLIDILNKHAPTIKRKVILRPNAPWHNDNIRESRKIRRKLERRYRKSGLEIDKQVFRKQCDIVNNMCHMAKVDYNRDRILDCSDKGLFRLVNELTEEKVVALPKHVSSQDLANNFCQYFNTKIEKIRTELDASVTSEHSSDYAHQFSGSKMNSFNPVTEDEVTKTIISSPTKNCSLDPIPTWLLKRCLHVLVPVITRIINMSLEQGQVPSIFKSAIITPLIKKPSLDQDIMNNYRPVSGLSYLSKTLERLVAGQLRQHLDIHGLLDEYQSAYRPFYSTESALLSVVNELLMALDGRKQILLTLLDLSAAFDTVDHVLLLRRLELEIGITGSALAWFSSYLQGRSQSVGIKGVKSDQITLKYGVPQGSVLGPVLFTLYTLPLGRLIQSFGLQYHLYADDCQIIQPFQPSEAAQCCSSLKECTLAVVSWMKYNKLKLNCSKTEVINIHSQYQEAKINRIIVGDDYISPSPVIRDLGAWLDDHLSMATHVSKICTAGYIGIRKIGKIRPYLDKDSTERLVHAFVTSRLDLNNALLYNVPDTLLANLQRLQNTSARLVSKCRKSDHITPVLKDLHWLPVKERIKYKILLMCFKCLNGKGPSYLAGLLSPYLPPRSLRSADSGQLTKPRVRTSKYGERSFAFAAPLLWNALNRDVRNAKSVESFKGCLKTELFNERFSD